MRIRVNPSRRRLDRITLNLASMIDVTFLLLIYFLVTQVMARPEDRLSPLLQTRQEQATGQQSDFQTQIVEVLSLDGRPTYRIGSRTMTDRQALRAVLDELPTGEGVIIEVAGQVPVEFAFAAIQVASDAGFEQVTYVPTE